MIRGYKYSRNVLDLGARRNRTEFGIIFLGRNNLAVKIVGDQLDAGYLQDLEGITYLNPIEATEELVINAENLAKAKLALKQDIESVKVLIAQ